MELRLAVFRKHQPSLIRLTSSRALCLVLQDFLFSSVLWSTTRFGSVSAAPSRYKRTYSPHNAASLVSRPKEARKRGRYVAANHAASAPSKARTRTQFSRVVDILANPTIRKCHNFLYTGAAEDDSCGGYFLHKMLKSKRKYSP